MPTISQLHCLWILLVNKTECFSRLLTIWALKECQQTVCWKYLRNMKISNTYADTHLFCSMCNQNRTQLHRTLKQTTFGITHSVSRKDRVYDSLTTWILPPTKCTYCTQKNEKKEENKKNSLNLNHTTNHRLWHSDIFFSSEWELQSLTAILFCTVFINLFEITEFTVLQS